MPIYEYACPSCGKRFEEMQKISDPPITVCPDCGGGEVKKLISATSFVLKGSGWYRDHYGLKSGGGSAEGSSSGAASSGAPSSGAAPASAGASAPAAGGSSSGGSSSGGSGGSSAPSSGGSSASGSAS